MVKKLLILILVMIGAVLIYKNFIKKEEPKGEKPKPIAVSKHSDAFNQSIEKILNNYYAMHDGFVNWDLAVVNQSASTLQTSLQNFNTEELKKDSTIYQTVLFPYDNAKNNVALILSSAAWNEKRRALHDLSDNLRNILQIVKYDRAVVYWQECPMAFGEGMAGNWLSAKEEVVNPYLGNKDPQYGSTMVNCGETKMRIDFTAQDSTSNK